jgi:glycosyltransferase involved in cell wall biosynthesis
VEESDARIGVLLVGPSLDILGGQAVQLQRLLERLRARPGLQIGFLPVNPRLPGPLRGLQRVKYVRTMVTSLAYVTGLLRQVRSYDVVHAFSASYWSFLLAPLPALVAGRLFGRATILNYRSGEAPDHLRHWPLSRWMMRLADAIVVPSPYLVEIFARHGLAATAIANFVDVEGIPFRERTLLRPVFLSNRNFEPLYNVACTLRAFARVQRELPAASLIVAGYGREEARLQSLARDLKLSGVEFVGRMAPEQMARLYDRADVYLNTPNIDNMPNSVLEAFTAGLPVVTTSAGGVPFVAVHDRNALLVPCDDDAAVAAAAIRLFREPGLATRLSSQARQEALQRYVWSEVGPQWEALYARIRHHGRARRAGARRAS